MKIISLGWGVQSFTLAAMSALGELEPVNAAVHADTLHESQLTYQFAEKWTPWLENHGVKVVTVKNPTGGMTDEAMKTQKGLYIPAFTHDERGKGMLPRSCTRGWKIVPMRRWMQENRDGAQVEQWLGISLDEFQRMKPAEVKYITTRWPLIELKMTRDDCVKWLNLRDLEIPPKSSCTFCPFHSMNEWRRIKANESDWTEAVKIDKAIRNLRGKNRDLYLHPSRKPLEAVDLRSDQERGQLSLWDNECSGICGV